MELHHITPGGKSDFDNCIALCFDCHADMRSYDAAHPKGRKYTVAEQKRHRQAWLARVQTTPASSSSSQQLELDVQAYRRVLEQLPVDFTIAWLRDHDFGDSFRSEAPNPVFRFCEGYRHRPDFEFLDADLESARADLVAALGEFAEVVATETFEEAGTGVTRLPREWRETQAKRYGQSRHRLNTLSAQAVAKYDALVRLAHRKLGATCDLPREG